MSSEQPQQSTGRRAARFAGWAVLAVVILVLLFTTVFPWIERSLSSPTLGG